MIGVNGSLVALDQMSVILRGAWRRLPASCVHGFTKQSPLVHRDMSHFTHRLSSSPRSLATASILSTQLRYNENSKLIQMYQVRKLSDGDFKSPRVPKRMTHQVLDLHKFEQIVDDTLQSLCERFEEYLEEKADSVLLTTSDVSLSSGVLNFQVGNEIGTYVINKQTPNRQIWLSSPKSGPKRYDFDPEKQQWIYKHDGVSLHELLTQEFKKIFNDPNNIDFTTCAYGGKKKF